MKKIYLLLVLSLTFTACQKEEIMEKSTEGALGLEPNIQEISVADLPPGTIETFNKNTLTGNKMKTRNSFGSVRTDIPGVKITDAEGVVSYTLALQNPNSFKTAEGLYFNNLVIKRSKNGDRKIYIFQYEPDERWFYESKRIFANYSGTVNIFDLEGKRLGGMLLENGILAKRKNGHLKANATWECTWAYVESFCILDSETLEEVKCSYFFKEECSYTSGGDTDTNNETGGTPTGGTYTGDGGDTTTGGPSGGNADGSDDEEGVNTQPVWEDLSDSEEEDKIVNHLEGQDRCVYDKLKDLNLFKETIGVFDNNDDYILNIIYGDCVYSGADACADGGEIGNGIVTIKIESVGQGTLDFAASLLHEGIHAEIYKYVEEHRNGIDPSKRANLLYYYFHYKAKNRLDLGTTEAQHQYMADNYVKPIARAIRQLDGSRYELEHYMGFGWDGLRAYGYDGYYDNGKWVNLIKDESSDYYIKQRNVILTTNFPGTCEE